MSFSKRQTSPGDAQKIAAHAREHLHCGDCGAEPGSPCAGSDRIVCRSRYIAAATALRRQARDVRLTPDEAAERAAILASLPQVSREEIEACRTPKGGYSFTRERLASWGVPWPPPAGWRRALQRGEDGTDAGGEGER